MKKQIETDYNETIKRPALSLYEYIYSPTKATHGNIDIRNSRISNIKSRQGQKYTIMTPR